jgi:error-prone DNA polymerase
VLFVTIEGETGVANLVIWRKLHARQRRVILGARTLGVQGQIRRGRGRASRISSPISRRS